MLVVSGGHTSLYLVRTPGHYQLLSRTRDDAAGEAYDKVAKLLGLGLSGRSGHRSAREAGNDRAIALPRTRLTHADRNAPQLKGDLDFSFSGLKTAVLRHVTQRREQGTAARPIRRSPTSAPASSASWSKTLRRTDLHAAAALWRQQRRRRRRRVGQQPPARGHQGDGDAREMPTFVPSLQLSTDNAAMIAAAGLRSSARSISQLDLNADAALALDRQEHGQRTGSSSRGQSQSQGQNRGWTEDSHPARRPGPTQP